MGCNNIASVSDALQALVWVVTGPVRMCIAAGQSMGAAGRGVWQGAQPLRQAATSAAGLVRTASMAAPATQSSAQTLSQQVGFAPHGTGIYDRLPSI